MKNSNVLKYCGIASLIMGLSSCYMMNRPQYAEGMENDYPAHKRMHHERNMHHEKNMHHEMNTMDKSAHHATRTKHYASKDVTQKATPGPKHKAAPQLPVIQ